MSLACLEELSNGIYLATDKVVKICKNNLQPLHDSSQRLPQQRARICTHRSNDAAIHEMIITLQRGCYIHPHLHPNKTESFHIIEGRCDLLLFKKEGTIDEIISLADYQSGLPFFYRLSDPVFHTLLIHSPTLTIHETTNGPFRREEVVLAPWAPQEANTLACQDYLKEIAKKAASKHNPHEK